MITADQVYNELYPTFNQVALEVHVNPNTKRTHVISERKCLKHDVYFRIYKTIMRGKIYPKYMCHLCEKDRKRKKWKEKIKSIARLVSSG